MLRRTWLAVALGVALAVTVRVEEARVERARAGFIEAATRLSNMAAERDSTHDVAATNQRVAALLGDSLRVVERLVVQQRQRNDALDRALGAQRRGRYEVASTVRALDVTTTARRDSSSDARRAHFAVREEPYTVEAEVRIPSPPDTASMKLRVALDSLRLEALVSCSPPDGNGVRAAFLSATGPRWASVTIGRVEQAAEICNPPSVSRRSRWWRVKFTPLVVGVGCVVGGSGPATWGVFVGVGVSAWG